MPETEVTPQGAQPSGAGVNPQGGKGNEKIEISRSEFESLRRERDELQRANKDWGNFVRSKAIAPNATEQTEDQDDLVETGDLVPDVTGDESVDKAIFSDPDKWAEAVSKGPKAIWAFIRQAGVVTADEVADIAAKVARRTVEVERTRNTTDATIATEFAELKDSKSDLFKATALELRKLVSLDPSAKNRPSTLYAAATAAKAKLEAKAATDRRRSPEPEDDDRYDRIDEDQEEQDRRGRIAAQDGRTRTRERDDDADMLGPQAREVISAMGISEDEFKASAKELSAGRRRERR